MKGRHTRHHIFVRNDIILILGLGFRVWGLPKPIFTLLILIIIMRSSLHGFRLSCSLRIEGWVFVGVYIRVYIGVYIKALLQNQMENDMENDMETGISAR